MTLVSTRRSRCPAALAPGGDQRVDFGVRGRVPAHASLVLCEARGRWAAFRGVLFACAASVVVSSSVDAASGADDRPGMPDGERAAETSGFAIATQPVDRWVRLGATLFRAVGADDLADKFAVQARVIASAIQLDPTRPVAITGDLAASSGDELELVESSLMALLPTIVRKPVASGTRIRFDETSGVRQIAESDEPLAREEFFAHVVDGWALIGKDRDFVNGSQHSAFVERFRVPPETLARCRISPLITSERKRSFANQLWQDVERDVKRGADEPAIVHSVRREIQTSLGTALAAAIEEVDELDFTLDVSDDHRVDAAVGLGWQSDGVVNRWLAQLGPANSRLLPGSELRSVVRLVSCFDMPSRTSRRLSRWVDSAGHAATELMKRADKRRWQGVIAAARETLAPALASKRFDVLIDVPRVDSKIAVHFAIGIPSQQLIESIVDVANDAKVPLRHESIGDVSFVRVGEPQRNANPIFGQTPGLWLASTAFSTHAIFGSESSVKAVAATLTVASTLKDRSSGLAASDLSASASSPQPATGKPSDLRLGTNGDVGQPLATLTIDLNEAQRVLGMIKRDRGADDLYRLLLAIDEPAEPISAQLSVQDTGLLLQCAVPREAILGVMREFVRDK